MKKVTTLGYNCNTRVGLIHSLCLEIGSTLGWGAYNVQIEMYQTMVEFHFEFIGTGFLIIYGIIGSVALWFILFVTQNHCRCGEELSTFEVF